MTEYTITIDLVPYRVTYGNRRFIIWGIQGSTLAKLDNRVETTGNRYSEDRCCTKIGGSHCYVEYQEGRSGHNLAIQVRTGFQVPTFEQLMSWVRDNLDRMDSIGYEMLEKW